MNVEFQIKINAMFFFKYKTSLQHNTTELFQESVKAPNFYCFQHIATLLSVAHFRIYGADIQYPWQPSISSSSLAPSRLIIVSMCVWPGLQYLNCNEETQKIEYASMGHFMTFKNVFSYLISMIFIFPARQPIRTLNFHWQLLWRARIYFPCIDVGAIMNQYQYGQR